jgi:hypothetical protein
LGEYLLHARVITFSALVEAIIWQRRQRERFCEVGRRWGYLDGAAAELLLARRRPLEPVGAAAQRLRLLTGAQVRAVLWFQRSRQSPIGGYFVERGVLTPAELARHLRALDGHNASLRRR